MLLGFALGSEAAEMVLVPGEVVERELAGGEFHRYELDWLQGQEFWLTAHQNGIDLSVSVLTTNGEARLSVDSPSGRWGAEWMRFRVKPGDQAIEIRALAEQSPRGRYQLRMEHRRPLDLAHRYRDSTERAMTAAGRLYLIGDRDVRHRVLSYYRDALGGWTRLGRDVEAAASLFHIAILERKLHSASQSLQTLRQALDKFERLGDQEGQARAWMEIGRAIHRLGEPEEADEAFKKSLWFWRQAGDRHGEARALGLWGLSYMRKDPLRARTFHEQVLVLSRELADTHLEAASLNNLGGIFNLVGDPDRALDQYEQALRILQEIGEQRQEAAAWNNIASIHRRTGRLQEALEGYRAALEVRLQSGDLRGQALVLNNLGLTWLALGDIAQAQEKPWRR